MNRVKAVRGGALGNLANLDGRCFYDAVIEELDQKAAGLIAW